MIILVRHGRTALNASHRLQGRVDAELDEVGVQQIRTVASDLSKRFEVARIVTSPLTRAQQSAALLTETLRHEPFVDERWIELDYGVWDGVELGAVPADVWHKWRTDPNFAPEGGESFAALDRRVEQACEELADDASSDHVVVVSHVSPMKSACAWALGADRSVAHRSRLDQAAICRIDIGPRGPVLVTFNETIATG